MSYFSFDEEDALKYFRSRQTQAQQHNKPKQIQQDASVQSVRSSQFTERSPLLDALTDSSISGGFNYVTDRMVSGLTFGLSDRLERGIDKAFDKILGENSKKPPEYRPSKPVETVGKVANVAGGIVSGGAALGAGKAVAAPAIKKAASSLTNFTKGLHPVIKTGLGVGTAATGFETVRGAVDADYADRRDTFPSKVGASLRAGTGDILDIAGNVAQWQGQDNLAQKLTSAGENIRRGFDDAERVKFSWKSWFDPDFYSTNVARTVPMTATLVPAMFAGWKMGGAGAAKLGLGAFGRTVAASIGGSALSRPLESAMEAGDVFGHMYQQELGKGKTEAEANLLADNAAQEAFDKNLALMGMDATQMALAFAPYGSVGGRIGKIMASRLGQAGLSAGRLAFGAGTEAAEEGIQYAIQQQAMGEEIDWSSPEAKEAMAIGGLFGGVMGGAGIVNDTIKTRLAVNGPPEIKTQLSQSIEVNLEKGMSDEEAVEQAYESIAETPEGKEAIRVITQEVASEIETEAGTQLGTLEALENIAAGQATATSAQPSLVTSAPSTVYDDQGNALRVIGQPNQEFYIVENTNGQRGIIHADEVSIEAPSNVTPANAQAQSPIPQGQAPQSVQQVLPETGQVVPPAQEATTPNIFEQGGLETPMASVPTTPVLNEPVQGEIEGVIGQSLLEQPAYKAGDTVYSKSSGKPLQVLSVNDDGTLQVENQKGNRMPIKAENVVAAVGDTSALPQALSGEPGVNAPATKDVAPVADGLRKQAESMQKTIDAKRNPAIGNQNPTARRARIASNMAKDAEVLEDTQSKVLLIAQSMEDGTLPQSLQGINKKTHVETLRRYAIRKSPGWGASISKHNAQDLLKATEGLKGPARLRKDLQSKLDMLDDNTYGVPVHSKKEINTIEALMGMAGDKLPSHTKTNIKDSLADFKRILDMGLSNEYKLEQAIRDFKALTASEKPKETSKEQAIKEKERELIGTKIPGYFPTPAPVIREMLALADIKSGMKVLEPSAGKGNIADAIRASVPDVELDVVEVNSTLREILEIKGYEIIGSDFMEVTEGSYDRIVMNPPFEKNQDIAHVLHAYELLKPGGRLVSIMSEHPFFANDKASKDFRDFMEEQGATSEKLPDKSFTGKDSDRQTGVAARIVVVNRMENDNNITQQQISRYEEFINAEVANMEGEIGGVINYRPGEDAPLLRASMNPAWYRAFWEANGRAPRAGEMRNMAIDRLMRGNSETGEPANQEFLAIISELSRGQQLPEEWHGLQQSIRETAAMDEAELEPLIKEMQAEQAQIEPSGINRDMGRLTDIENAVRGRTRMKDEADFEQYEDVRFKRATDKDLAVLQEAMTKRVGPFRIGKVELAPEALSKSDFQAAAAIADKLGLRVVPFKGVGHRGMQQGRTIYLNQNMKDPLDYVFWHEVGHTMEVTHPDHYDKLMGIALDHMKDAEGLLKHYKEFGYAMEDMPHEFAADVLAEALSEPGFFARVSKQAPELLKSLLEAINKLISSIRGMISKDDSVLPYLENLETLRNKIQKEVVEPYFWDAMGEKQFVESFGKQWQDSAAKAKGGAGINKRLIDEEMNIYRYETDGGYLDIIVDDNTGEALVDFVGVDSPRRGQGQATALLNAAARDYALYGKPESESGLRLIKKVGASQEKPSAEWINEQQPTWNGKAKEVMESEGHDPYLTWRIPEWHGNARIKLEREQKAPIFYSQLQKVIEQKMPNKAHPPQVMSIIKGGQVKADEVKWSGIEQWLLAQKGKVDKQDVLDFIQASDLGISEQFAAGRWHIKDVEGETLYFDSPKEAEEELQSQSAWIEDEAYVVDYDEADDAITVNDWNGNLIVRIEGDEDGEYLITSDRENYLEDYRPYIIDDLDKAMEIAEEAAHNAGDRFRNNLSNEVMPDEESMFINYTLPGGENYRELLFTLPSNPTLKPGMEIRQGEDGLWNLYERGKPVYVDGLSTRDAVINQAAGDEMLDSKANTSFKSSHWSEPNVLAHTRFNDRTGPNGEKILFIEEVQSDWHQDGRQKGYLDSESNVLLQQIKALEREIDQTYDPVFDGPRDKWVMPDKTQKLHAEKETLVNKLKEKGVDVNKVGVNPVPDAPLKTTWHEFVLKRMLRYAAENGYDAIAWTTGEQQAERYDLSKHISELGYWREEGGTWGVSILDKDGRALDSWNPKEGLTESELEQQLGKELAAKIIKNEGDANPEVSEYIDVNTGKLEPGVSVIQEDGLKIGGEGMKGFYDKILPAFLNKYAKKWGAKETLQPLRLGDETKPVHYLTVTDAMKESVLYTGQPRFKRTKADKFTLPDSEVQERMEKAHGVPKDSMRSKVAEVLREIYYKGHREYEHLPRTGEYAELRNSLLNLRKQKGISADKTLRVLDDLTKPLNEYEYDVFSHKVIFDDLANEFKEGNLLPFGLNQENFEDIKKYVDEEAATLPKVQEAISKRKQAWQNIKNQYISAQKAAGFNVEDRLRKEDYYHHQVLEYAHTKGIMGGGKRLRIATGRGFLKQRGGSSYDINTDYLQAEFEVMAQMLLDAATAKTVKVVKDNHDIIKALKREAISLNDEAMLKEFESMLAAIEDTETTPVQMYRKHLNKKQAIAFSNLYDLAARGELPAGPKGKYQSLIDEMAKSYWTAREDGGERAELPPGLKDELWPYLNYLAGNENENETSKIVARTVFKGRAQKIKSIQNALGDRYVTWEDLIPPGYTKWQPREGNMFHLANSVPESMAEQLFYGIVSEMKLDANNLKKVMAVGQKYPEMVIKEEVALTLEDMSGAMTAKDNKIVKVLYFTPYRAWKQYQLISPRRYFKYNARNMTGDLDAVIAGNPSALKPANVKKAWGDLWQAFFAKDKGLSPELQSWFERGGFETLMQAQEINDINRNRQFAHLMESRTEKPAWEKMLKSPATLWNTYWDFARTTTDFREALMRYACYLDYMKQMQNNNGKPKNFGASNRDEIMALKDEKDRAAKLANELLGAYDEVSVIGTWLADHMFPFWRWNEVNFVRYSKLFKNAFQDGKLMASIAGKVTGITIRSPFIAWKIGVFIVKAAALTALITAWNWKFFNDEEKELPEDVRSRLHIIFGRDEGGDILYFSRLGALQDFIDWFGIDTPVKTVQDYLSGRKSIKEIAIDWAKADANKVINAISPVIKIPVELLVERKLYPDAFNAMPIRDKWQYLADSFALGNEYKALTGKPTRGYSSSIPGMFVYKSDPYETAYFANKENIRRYQKEIGKYNEGYSESIRSEALYNIKLSVRYGDKKAFEKYLLEYVVLGGTEKGLRQSMKSLSPLYGLSKDDQVGYIESLDAVGKENLIKAIDYYQKVIGGKMFEEDD